MRKLTTLVIMMAILCTTVFAQGKKENRNPKPKNAPKGWVQLFNGKNLDGWKFSENEGTFSVQDGMIVVNGNRSHLYYDGPFQNHYFKNFMLKLEIMTEPGSNSGVYFHTEFQQDGWPSKGYEVQVNNTHTDWRKTSGLYAVQDIKEVPVKDKEWFTMEIMVKGKHIVTKLNDKVMVDYVEPENVNYEGMPGRKISGGTICLQGHDPGSKVYYRSILIKPLP